MLAHQAITLVRDTHQLQKAIDSVLCVVRFDNSSLSSSGHTQLILVRMMAPQKF